MSDKKDVGESAIELDSVSVGDHHDREPDARPRSSGILKTTVNVINTIIGSGILGLPASIALIVYILGGVLLVVGAFAIFIGLHYLSKVADRIGGTETSFGAAANRTYWWMAIVVDVVLAISTFGITVAYLGIAAGILPFCVKLFSPDISDDNVLVNRTFWLFITWGLLAAPLSMLRSVNFLSYTSGIAVLCMFWTTTVVALHFFDVFDPCQSVKAGETCKGNVEPVIFDFMGIFKAIPVFVTSFCCSPTHFNLYNDLINPSVKRLDIAAISGLALSTILYGFVGILGYMTYGDVVKDNVLNYYPISVPVTIARIGTAFVVTVSYPLLMHPARDALVHAIQTIISYGVRSEEGKEKVFDPHTKFNIFLFYGMAAIMNVASLLMALLKINLDTILSVTGAVGFTNLALTIPALYYWKMFEDVKPGDNSSKNLIFSDHTKRMLCIPTIIAGLFLMGASTYANFA